MHPNASSRGVRSINKLGGASVSRGTFEIKRAPKKLFPEMLSTGGGEVGKEK
jgi:hypothetical protein